MWASQATLKIQLESPPGANRGNAPTEGGAFPRLASVCTSLENWDVLPTLRVLGLQLSKFNSKLNWDLSCSATFFKRKHLTNPILSASGPRHAHARPLHSTGFCAIWDCISSSSYSVFTAIFAWSDLILDRSQKLLGLQSQAACAISAGGDPGPNFENYDLTHAQSPDTGHGLHARSWHANRDVDVRRYFPK